MITIKEIESLASLSRVEFTAEEKEKMVSEISSILGFVGKITELDLSEVERKYPNINVLRDDVVLNGSGEFSQKILSNAPERVGDYFKVKKILN